MLLGLATAPAARAARRRTGPLPTAPANPNDVSRVQSLGATPAGHRLAGAQALAIAARSPKVNEALRQYPKAKPEVFLKGPNDWQVSWFTPGTGEARKEVAQVKVADATGEDHRGLQRAAGRVDDGARLRRARSGARSTRRGSGSRCRCCSSRRSARCAGRPGMLQLDLLVLVGFGVSVAFFNDAEHRRVGPDRHRAVVLPLAQDAVDRLSPNA